MRFLFDPKIKHSGRRYLWQVSLATVSLFAVVFVEELITGQIGGQAVIVAAIASTAFLLFIWPHSRPSHPRNVLGGHALALGVGVLFALFGDTETWRETAGGGAAFYFALFAAASVGLSMFLMAATSTEHPPAAGTALGVAGSPITLDLLLFVLLGVPVLVAVYLVFRRRLVNLY
ncbi:MAG: HPP family protein [Chloroflexota bacterium]|nr:HPP family protein [Chloroflexota bacterium]